MKSLPSSTSYAALLRTYLLDENSALPDPWAETKTLSILPSGSMAKCIKLHESIVSGCIGKLAGKAQISRTLKRAARFFAEAIAMADNQKRRPVRTQLVKSVETLSHHALELATMRRELQKALREKNTAILTLQKNQNHHALLLKKSENQQFQLRTLSRKLLSAQEDERLKISRDLHDVIAQTLAGININLAMLLQQAGDSSKALIRNINSTQRLVEQSVQIVHQFACELRPPVIDVLGLISALESLLKKFSATHHIQSGLQTNSQLSQLSTTQRTCLFRVAEEALTNVAKHSGAGHVTIVFKTNKSSVTMTILDDGKSFHPQDIGKDDSGTHLGLPGMRERVEMLDGTLNIESSAAKGTAIIAKIPLSLKPKPAASS